MHLALALRSQNAAETLRKATNMTPAEADGGGGDGSGDPATSKGCSQVYA